MKKALVTFTGLVFFASVASTAELPNTNKFLDANVTRFFTAIEAKSYPESNAYSFELWCGYGNCTLRRIFYSECRDAEDKRGEVMNVSSDSFTTKDKSLQIEFLTPRSLSLKFTTKDMPYKKDFRISVSYDKAIEDWTSNLTSLSGVVLQTPLVGAKSEKVFELKRIRGNEERLKRSCPIGLTLM